MKEKGVITAKPERSESKLGAFLIKRLLGRILIDGRFISKKDLEKSLALQKRTNEQLGAILVRMGILDSSALDAALSIQRDLASPEDAIKLAAGTRRLLGELLLQARHISKQDLETVLEEQQKTGEKLGELLKRRGLLTEGELKAVLAFQKQQGIEKPVAGKLRLGELLVATNQITRKQLEDALKKQKVSRKRIGEILIEEGHVKPQQVDHVLKLQQKLVTAALIAALSIAGTLIPKRAYTAGPSISGSAKVVVTARVMPYAQLKILKQSMELVITNRDIARGYVDIPAASHIEIKNNNPAGCLLVFEGLGGPMNFIKGVYVRGGGREVYMESGGWMAQPYTRTPMTMELSYRFVLSQDAKPGTYNWPLTISVRHV